MLDKQTNKRKYSKPLLTCYAHFSTKTKGSGTGATFDCYDVTNDEPKFGSSFTSTNC